MITVLMTIIQSDNVIITVPSLSLQSSGNHYRFSQVIKSFITFADGSSLSLFQSDMSSLSLFHFGDNVIITKVIMSLSKVIMSLSLSDNDYSLDHHLTATRCNIMCCSALQCVAACCSVLQRVAACCIVLILT